MSPSPAPARAKRAPGSFTCNACGAKYVEEAWATLALSKRMEAGEVQRHVLTWPDDLCIEVRACRSCDALMARRFGRYAAAG